MFSRLLQGARDRHGFLRDGTFVALVLSCQLAWAADAASVRRYRIDQPSQLLAESLRAIGRQTGVSVVFDPAKVGDRTAPALSGQMTASEAIAVVLEGSGFELTQMPDGAIVVKAVSIPRASGTASTSGSRPSATPGQPPAAPSGATPSRKIEPGADKLIQASPATDADAGGAKAGVAVSLTRVEVTGTRLKLIDSFGPTPVNVYTRADIERSGQPSLERFLSTLNEAMSPGEGAQSAPNGQAAVQLRGLPLGSTLVLINGRRVQASGASLSRFFNMNLIPMAAVERVEVVPVGSSAVYGGDALAGVVNIILKKQIEGLVLDARGATGRGVGDGSISVGTGGGDASSSYLVLGSYRKLTPLTMSERGDFFADADYRRFGGVDARARYCPPGTVSSASSANLPGLNSSFAAIPPVASGQRLTVADFVATAGQANLCNTLATGDGSTLIHGTESYGLHAAADFQLPNAWSLFGELTASTDKLRTKEAGILMANVLVPATNAFNPFGVAVRVSSRLGPENGAESQTRETTFARALIGLRGEVLPGWELEATASTARDDGDYRSENSTANAAARTAALASSNPAQALNLFTGGRAGSDELLATVWPAILRHDEGSKDQLAAFLRGSPLNLPTGPVDVIIGAEAARDMYLTHAVGADAPERRRSSHAAYGEARIPLWRAGADEGGKARDLASLTLAGRRDVYSDFGGANTYQAGIEVRPSRSTLLRASAASSFKPPTLTQLNVNTVSLTTEAYPVRDPRRGNASVQGGEVLRTSNPDLDPEKGRAYSLGAVWEPEAVPGARLGVTAWQVKINGLIGLLQPQTAVDNEDLFPGFVTRGPSLNGAPGPITRVLFTEVNVGRLETAGVDMEIAHTWKTGATRWNASASATRTRQYEVALTPGVAATSRLGVRNPDYWAPRWKGRLQLGVEQGPWSLGLTSRYLSSYRDAGTNGRALGSYWIHDLAGSVSLKRLGLGAGFGLSTFKDARMSAAIANVGNRLPEYVGSTPYYDVTQADWRGRYMSLRVSLSW